MQISSLLQVLGPTVLLAALSVIQSAKAKRDPHICCGACIAMIEDLKIMISQVDKKKKLQTGSYRIMPDGSQQLKEVVWATSELHLMELFEKICNTMTNYAEMTDETTGHKTIIRTSSYDGTPVSLKNIKMSGERTSSLKFACETIIEEHEEDMIKILQLDGPEPEKEICIHITGSCTEDDIQARMWAMASALMAGMQEKEAASKGEQAGDKFQEEGDTSQTDGDSLHEKERETKIRDMPSADDLGEDITELLMKEGSMTVGRKEKEEL